MVKPPPLPLPTAIPPNSLENTMQNPWIKLKVALLSCTCTRNNKTGIITLTDENVDICYSKG